MCFMDEVIVGDNAALVTHIISNCSVAFKHAPVGSTHAGYKGPHNDLLLCYVVVVIVTDFVVVVDIDISCFCFIFLNFFSESGGRKNDYLCCIFTFVYKIITIATL